MRQKFSWLFFKKEKAGRLFSLVKLAFWTLDLWSVEMAFFLFFLHLSILKCLWFCSAVGTVCRPGRNLAPELQTGPSWESWPCIPGLRSSAVLLSPRKRWRAPGNARSRSTSTTHRPLWTEEETEMKCRGGGKVQLTLKWNPANEKLSLKH